MSQLFRMTRRFLAVYSGVTAIAALTALYGVADIPSTLLRAAVGVQLLWIGYGFASPRLDFRAFSPLFLLPALGYVLYVAAPALYAALGGLPGVPDWMYVKFLSYFGSRAELTVLQFVSLCLCAALALPAESRRSTSPVPARDDATVRLTAVAVGSAAALLKLIDSKVAELDTLFGGGLLLHDALPPIAFLCIAAALLFASKGSRRVLVATAAWAACCLLAFLASDLARLPLALALFATGMAVAARGLSPAKVVAVAIPAIAAAALLAAAANSYRVKRAVDYPQSYADVFFRSFSHKFLLRHAASGHCFDRALKKHWDSTPFTLSHTALAGLVPRAIWPDKPSLSRGADYAVQYCDAVMNAERPHAEALTLLSEPVIDAGKFGLIPGETIVILLLATAAYGMTRYGPIAFAAGIAMLPWLTGFEQHLAFFVANGVKMLLLMVPVALALYLVSILTKSRRAR